ncbi:MAG: ATP-binding protein [Thiolinea sp.]
MERSQPYRDLRFEVRDTGVGISAAQIEEIFKPFTHYQEPNPGAAAVPDNPNSGLGLSIVRKLADMMGGIWMWKVLPASAAVSGLMSR